MPKPMCEGFMELACERSLRLDRRLGDSEYVTGRSRSRSRLDWVWFDVLWVRGARVLPLVGLCWLSDGARGRGGPKGLMKVGEPGVMGLMGPAMLGCMWAWMQRDQSCRLCCSSPGRNHSVVGAASLAGVRPAVRLDRRLRNLSAAGSGAMLTTSVGRTGPCFRCDTICT